jgi:hypothetical protein
MLGRWLVSSLDMRAGEATLVAQRGWKLGQGDTVSV